MTATGTLAPSEVVAVSDRAEYDRDTYQYGTRSDELQHAYRELEQLQMGLMSGALTQDEYEEASARIRERYGIEPWGVNAGP